jgi:hypothetical protein
MKFYDFTADTRCKAVRTIDLSVNVQSLAFCASLFI